MNPQTVGDDEECRMAQHELVKGERRHWPKPMGRGKSID